MNTNINTQIKKCEQQKRKRKAWKKVVTCLASVVVFATVYMLILPAITMESECYCGYEEHTHEAACYEQVISCELPTAHVHGPDCYIKESIQICEQDHVHIEDCFEEQKTVVCELTEDGHVHEADCYDSKLICEEEVHEHTLACRSNPNADVETAYNWEATLPEELSGNLAEDVLAIAVSQLGYRESDDNYVVSENGTTRGYTRYGAWYGDPYGDWCAMFASFCLDYAGVEGFPLESNCQSWRAKLTELDLYMDADTYVPQPGDLIFFDWNGDTKLDHVGLVEEYLLAEENETKDRIKTIEGNSGNCAKRNTYEVDDSTIVGYGILPSNKMQLNEESLMGQYSFINQTGTIMYLAPDMIRYQYSSHRLDGFEIFNNVLMPSVDCVNGEWMPSTKDWSAATDANYVVAYYLDGTFDALDTGKEYVTCAIEESVDYKDRAQVLSGIVHHAYPFISGEQMRQELLDAYNTGEIAIDVSCCSESEFIAATQWAIWDAIDVSRESAIVSGSTFPENHAVVLNPLGDIGHTESNDIQGHVAVIRDWLMMQISPEKLKVDDHKSVVTENKDGTYSLETTVSMNRSLQENEILRVCFQSGEHVSEVDVLETGTQEVTVRLEGLVLEEVLSAQIHLSVSQEHMQVYVYNSDDCPDMISGQWKVDEYEQAFVVDIETTDIEVTKKWVDDNVGAQSVEVRLYADGKQYGEAVFLNEENNWTHKWTNLVKYKEDATEIEYTVKEVLIPGYCSAIESVSKEQFLVTNTKTDETISAFVTQQWAGNDGLYPDAVEVSLLQNGRAYGVPVILNASNDWSYAWEGLPLKQGDTEFSYSLKQTTLEDYVTVMESNTEEDGTLCFALTSTWHAEYAPLLLSKVDALQYDCLLSNAQFNLYRVVNEDEANAVQIPNTTDWGILESDVIRTGEDGSFLMEELWVGKTYCLLEVIAPSGYTTLDAPIVFTVEKDENNQPMVTVLSGENGIGDCGVNENGELYMLIRNEKAYILPETGGNGKQMYVIGGILLMMAAISFLLYKKHRKEVFTSS